MKIHPRRFVRFLTCCITLILAVYAVLHLMDGAYGDPPTYRAEILSAEEEAGNIKVFAPGSVQYRVRIRLDDGPDEGKEVHLIHRTLNNPAFDIHPQEDVRRGEKNQRDQSFCDEQDGKEERDQCL